MTLALVVSSSMMGGCAATSEMAGRAVQWIPWMGSNPTVQSDAVPEKTVRTRNLALTLRLAPFPVKLSDTRRIEVSIRLKNISRHFIQLEFPTTQRFDVTVQDETGAMVAQWSEDQPFEPVASYVGINPGEQLEYKAILATRDMLPGQSYRITAFFPSRTDLKAELTLVPQK